MSMEQKYQKAEQLIPTQTKESVLNGDIVVHWIDHSNFWYLMDEKHEQQVVKKFVIVSCTTGKKDVAFNYTQLISTYNHLSQTNYTVYNFPAHDMTFNLKERIFSFKVGYQKYEYDVEEDHLVCTQKQTQHAENSTVSPNGKYVAYTRDFNLFIDDFETGETVQLTQDGSAYFDYASHPESNNRSVYQQINRTKLKPGIVWSPDSTKILTYKLDQRHVKPLHVIQSVTDDDHLRPQLYSYRYHLPGDQHIPEVHLYMCDLIRKTCEPIAIDPLYINFTPPFTEEYKKVLWSKNSDFVFITRLNRDFKKVSVYIVDTDSLEIRTILEENSDTFLFLDTFEVMDGYKDYGFNHTLLEETNQFIWHSEKSGWSHLYLHDLHTGQLITPLTSGHWVVRRLIGIDQSNGWVYFTAGGREEKRDPYYEHLYRVRLDGSELMLLTPEDADHQISFSPDMSYFVDTYSRIDLPPKTIIRKANGTLVKTIEVSDISDLLKRGYIFPERIKVKSNDGLYNLYGLIIKPAQFREDKKFPLIDYAYGGVQTIHTPKRFTWTSDYPDALGGLQSLAQLGFIGFMIDGKGTPQRSKKFHDDSYQNLQKSAGLKDHIHAIKSLAQQYSFIDLDRVGVWGYSGGGYATARAMLEYPDFYKVGISAAGNHDQRLYNASWVERYNGLFNKEIYEKQDNTKLAKHLKGKLLLAHGDLDDNVHISQTIRLIDALIKENKDFDFILMPNEYHFLTQNLYFIRKKWDYFVKHLLNEEPPYEYLIKSNE